MNICSHCGVEFDQEVSTCPLCGLKNGDVAIDETTTESIHYPSDVLMLHKKAARNHLWELTGIIAFSGITVCTIVDLVLGKKLSWSLYADAAIISAWIALSLILLTSKRYYIVIPGLLLTILSMLFFFDLFAPPVNWFYGIALPVTIALFISVSIVVVLWKIAHFYGFNILALAFLVLSGFCIVSEVFIDRYLFGHVEIRWSAIVAVSIFPIALVLLFIHYRMKKGKRLDSYFHV